MSDTYPETVPAEPAAPAVGSLGEAIPCEQCGEHRARYGVFDMEERDASLFCGSCMVLTFAKVANDLVAAGTEAEQTA